MNDRLKMHALSLLWASIGGLLVFAGSLLAANKAQPNLTQTGTPFVQEATRPCAMEPGGGTLIDSDNSGANLSGELSDWSKVLIQCDAEAYVAMGDDTVVAASGDLKIAPGAIWELTVFPNTRYISVLNTADATADCQYQECR